jgi:hypothetical protein
MEKESVRVRFPNECFFDKVKTFKLQDFEVKDIFQKEVFGKWIDIYVFVHIEDYNKLKDEQTN